jgi:hypothetical protein
MGPGRAVGGIELGYQLLDANVVPRGWRGLEAGAGSCALAGFACEYDQQLGRRR